VAPAFLRHEIIEVQLLRDSGSGWGARRQRYYTGAGRERKQYGSAD
jgi:hypothetical protein